MLKDKGTLIAIAVTVLLVAGGSFSYWKDFFGPNDAQLTKQAIEANRAEKPDQAITLADKAIKANSKNVDAHLALAEAYYRTNQFDKAIEEADWSIKSNLISNSAQLQSALYFEGLAYMSKGNYDKAETYLESARDTEPVTADACAAYGQVLIFQKAYKDAETALTQAIKLEQNDAQYYNLRGKARVGLKKYDAALEDLRRASGLEPKNAQYATDLAIVLEDQGEFAQALFFLEATLDEASTPELKKLETRLARKAFDVAVMDHRKNRNSPNPYADGALGALHNGAYNDAILSANKAIELSGGKHPLAYRYKADAEYHLGKYEDALLDYKRALAINPDDEFTERHKNRVLEILRKGDTTASK